MPFSPDGEPEVTEAREVLAGRTPARRHAEAVVQAEIRRLAQAIRQRPVIPQRPDGDDAAAAA